eukprot:763928-Hanusia_phi.AAC.2
MEKQRERAVAARHNYNELVRRQSLTTATSMLKDAEREEEALKEAEKRHHERVIEAEDARMRAEKAREAHEDMIQYEQNIKDRDFKEMPAISEEQTHALKTMFGGSLQRKLFDVDIDEEEYNEARGEGEDQEQEEKEDDDDESGLTAEVEAHTESLLQRMEAELEERDLQAARRTFKEITDFYEKSSHILVHEEFYSRKDKMSSKLHAREEQMQQEKEEAEMQLAAVKDLIEEVTLSSSSASFYSSSSASASLSSASSSSASSFSCLSLYFFSPPSFPSPSLPPSLPPPPQPSFPSSPISSTTSFTTTTSSSPYPTLIPLSSSLSSS